MNSYRHNVEIYISNGYAEHPEETLLHVPYRLEAPTKYEHEIRRSRSEEIRTLGWTLCHKKISNLTVSQIIYKVLKSIFV